MSKKRLNSTILSALCLLSFSVQVALPAHAQDLGATPGLLGDVTPKQAAADELTINGKDQLVDAIKTATKALENPSVKEFTIKLATCEKQLLPSEINAKGKIIIVGCNETAAGVGGNDQVERSYLYPSPVFNAIQVKSPLEIRGVNLVYNQAGFKISDNLTVKNSVIEQKVPTAVQQSRFIEFAYDLNTSDQKTVHFEQSTFKGARLHVGDFGRATYTLKNNVLAYDPVKENPTLELSPVKGNPKTVTVEGNKFVADKTWLFGAFVSIARPNVEINNNTFTMERPHRDAIAFDVMNPEPSAGAPIANVVITGNTIKAPYVMLNAKGQPIARDGIRFNQNDLTGSVFMLPHNNDPLGAKDTVTPKDHIDATRNTWGRINRQQVKARTEHPLTPDSPEQPSSKEIVVNTKNGLAGAIGEAMKFLADPYHHHVTIRVTTCDQQLLPPGIDAQGKIVIIGCGTDKAGVEGNDAAKRTELVFPETRYGVIINSPVEFNGFSGTVTNKAFNPNDTLVVKNSVFTGKPAYFFSNPHFFNAAMPFTPDTKRLVLEDSTLNGLVAFLGKGQTQDISFKNNKITFDPVVGAPAIDLYPNVATKGKVEMVGNAFVSNKAGEASAFMEVHRPDVHMAKNTFVFKNVAPNFAGIRLYDMSPGDGPAIANVHIEYNAFEGGVAVSNPKSTPLTPNAVRFNHNDVSQATGVLPTDQRDFSTLYSTSPKAAVDATQNFWGPLDRGKVQAITDLPEMDKGKTGPGAYVPPVAPLAPPTPPGPPAPPATPGNGGGNQGGGSGSGSQPGRPNPPAPQPPAPVSPGSGNNDTNVASKGKPTRRFAGETRFETASGISKAQYNTERRVVILARADVAADSVSAVPLADEYDAPILLTQPDTLHPEAASEIKRLLPKGGKVIFMGGEVALNKDVERAVTALGGQVERIAGLNRAGTAVETANWLKNAGKLKEVLLADGTDWQPDLIAGPVAAKVEGATLLTNGKAVAPETEAFLKANSQLPLTAIGTVAKDAGKVSKAVEGTDGAALSLAVAKQYFDKPKAVGLATTADFADALAGGAHVTEADGPILLTPAQVPADMVSWIRSVASIDRVYVYGGPARISEDALSPITKE